MGKLSFLGIGPKIGRIAIPYLVVTILLSIYYSELFVYSHQFSGTIFIIGIGLMAAGLVFYIITVRLLLTGLRQTKLVTSGTYYLCQNPLYAGLILMIIPALSLLLNSWLVLTTSVVAYIVFRMLIKSEYLEMELFFGDEYVNYRNATPEFLPFPVRKIMDILKTKQP
jgi:protein-S-isoprenylcysteine O-methyltransferase Ste14